MDRRAAAAIEQRGSTRPREARPDLLAWIHSRQAANHQKIKMKQALEKARKALTNTDSQIPLMEAQEDGLLEEVIEFRPPMADVDADTQGIDPEPPTHPVWVVSPRRTKKSVRMTDGGLLPQGGRFILDVRESKTEITASPIDGQSLKERFVPFNDPIGQLVSEVYDLGAYMRDAEDLIAEYHALEIKSAAEKAKTAEALKGYVRPDAWFLDTLQKTLRDPKAVFSNPHVVVGLKNTIIDLRAKNTAVQKFIDS